MTNLVEISDEEIKRRKNSSQMGVRRPCVSYPCCKWKSNAKKWENNLVSKRCNHREKNKTISGERTRIITRNNNCKAKRCSGGVDTISPMTCEFHAHFQNQQWELQKSNSNASDSRATGTFVQISVERGRLRKRREKKLSGRENRTLCGIRCNNMD